MSHYHLEIVMPPTDNAKAAVTKILAPFDEGNDKDCEGASGQPFFDYWRIGGQWSGAKVQAKLGEERIAAFNTALNAAGVTVSGLRFGKETLSPASQIEAVDAMWREHFPESPIKECPLFDHYKGNVGDVMRLDEVPQGLTCCRTIIAGPNYKGEGLEACYMVEDSFWNGVRHTKSAWSGKLSDAIAEHLESIKNGSPDYVKSRTPSPDWLVVTVDYHA
jgi:hypothetical protein